MRKVPLLMKRLSKTRSLFHVECSDYEEPASPLRDGEFYPDYGCLSYPNRVSVTKCCRCVHHFSFDTNNVYCTEE